MVFLKEYILGKGYILFWLLKRQPWLQQTTNFETSFLVLEKYKPFNYMRIVWQQAILMICYFWKSSKISNCRLLRIIGGALWVTKVSRRQQKQEQLPSMQRVKKSICITYFIDNTGVIIMRWINNTDKGLISSNILCIPVRIWWSKTNTFLNFYWLMEECSTGKATQIV